MAFDLNYYQNKKQNLIRKFQEKVQRRLLLAIEDYYQERKEIENELNEINRIIEEELKKKEPKEEKKK